MRFLFFVLLAVLLSPITFADEATHQLGNSGYAIRWAMDRGAAKKSPAHYWNALRLQNEAKARFENEEETIRLSREAEKEAILARKEAGAK